MEYQAGDGQMVQYPWRITNWIPNFTIRLAASYIGTKLYYTLIHYLALILSLFTTPIFPLAGYVHPPCITNTTLKLFNGNSV